MFLPLTIDVGAFGWAHVLERSKCDLVLFRVYHHLIHWQCV